MLVLTRKQNETIVIDNRIEVKVLQVKGNRIRIGIGAPADVAIRRGELEPLVVQEVELACDGPQAA